MYAHRHKATGLVALMLREDQLGRVHAGPLEEFEDIFIEGDPQEFFDQTLSSLSPESDGFVGNTYLIDDMSNPPPACPPGVLAPIDDTMDTPDIEHTVGTRTLRCMPVQRKKDLADALVEIMTEDNLPDTANFSVKTMKKAIDRAKGKTRQSGSVKPQKAR